MFKSISIIIIANILILLIYTQFQKSLEHNDGKGFDGVYYYEISEQIQNNDKISTKAPFVSRLGTPAIVTFLFDDIFFGFKVINIIFSILISILIYFISNIYLSNKISILLAIIYQLHWITGIRYILFDPISVDYIPLFLIYLSLYFILISHKHQVVIVVILSSIGVIFREICLLPIIILLYKMYSENEYKWKFLNKNEYFYKTLIMVIPFIIYFTLLLAVEFRFIEKTNDYNSIISIVKWIYTKGIGQFMHSFFIVYGLMLLIPILYFRKIKQNKKDFELMYLFILLIFILALIGGSDTERFLSWAFPIFTIIVTKIFIDTKFYKSKFFYLIIISLIFTFRLFWITPFKISSHESILPILTFISNDFNFADLLTMHGNKKFISVSLFQYLILSFVIIFLFKKNGEINGK